ncbi:MAG: ATP-binding protein [Actinomycetota bacterium]
MSIRWKLLLTALVPTTLAFVLLISFNAWAFQDYFQETIAEDLAARARLLRDSVTDAVAADAPERAALAARSASGPGIRARVFRADGSLLASSNPELDRRYDEWRSAAGVRQALSGHAAEGFGRGIVASGERYFVALPISQRQRVIGAVRISLSLAQFQRQLRRNLERQIQAMAGILLGCALVGLALARGIAGPIQAMAQFAAKIGSGRLGDTLKVESRDELGQLASELNRMSAQLASVDETRRVLLANVTHEFLTPVTNVQVTLEALQAGAAADPSLRDRFLENAFSEMERLKHLLEDLLDLGRLEAGISPLKTQERSLRELLEHSLRAIESRLLLKAVAASVSGPDALVRADPERLQQAFLAILDNAMKHSPEQSTISLRIDPGAEWVRVSIGDQGPGVVPADLPRIFDAFFVGDESRTGTGAGLGLAIARRIVEAHGGSIEAATPTGTGAEFTITLPLARSDAAE